MISVIMPVLNEAKYIERSLSGLLNQTIDDYEILVIDGGSSDGTCEIIKKMNSDRIRLMYNPGRIVPTALNIGIREARGENIVRADAHTEYSNDYIHKCSEYLKKTGADNVGGTMRAVGNSYISESIAFVYNSPFGLGGGKFHTAEDQRYVDTVYLGAWDRKVFEKYGYFNEKLVRNQDIEHNARIRKLGGKIFLTPEIKSYYYCRSNLKDLWLQNFRNGFWNIKTTKIAPGSLSLRHFVALFFVGSLLVAWIIPILWLSIITIYSFCNLFFSAKIALTKGFRYLLVVPVVFFTLHFSYGLGLLFGVSWYIKNINKHENLSSYTGL